MPPKKPERTVGSEARMARRIKAERETREWSLEQLAQRVTSHGCPLDRSAIYKIEQGSRRITLDEAVAISNVFGMSLKSLTIPLELAVSQRARELYAAWQKTEDELMAANQKMLSIRRELVAILEGDQREAAESALYESDVDLDEILGAGFLVIPPGLVSEDMLQLRGQMPTDFDLAYIVPTVKP